MAIQKQVSWSIFKGFVDSKQLSIQYIEFNSEYSLQAYDGGFSLECVLDKTPTDSTDLDDFVNNYKSNGNKRTDGMPRDSDGSPLQRSKITTSGWHYQLHGAEFTTSQLNSIYSKKDDNSDFGFMTIKCYDSENNELNTQEECDSSSVKTIIDWEPTHDYEIIGGMFKQASIPNSNVRLWVLGVPDVPPQYGGSKLFTANINLRYIGLEEGVKVDGRAPKYMTYNNVYHTNKLRLILKHDAGYKHEMHVVFELFKA